jgi:general secretion pathway protein E
VAREHAPSLFQDGQRLVIQGLTSFDELLRVTLED